MVEAGTGTRPRANGGNPAPTDVGTGSTDDDVGRAAWCVLVVHPTNDRTDGLPRSRRSFAHTVFP